MSINNNTNPRKGMRWIMYTLACIGVLILILGLIFPKEIKVEEKTIIDGKPHQLYNIASNIMNVEQWWPTFQGKENRKLTYSDMKFTKGAIANFEGKEKGFIRIDNLDSAKAIAFTTSLAGKESHYDLGLSPSDKGTDVVWQKSAKLSYPKNAFGPFLKYRWKKELRQSSTLMQKELTHRIKDTLYYGFKVREQTQNARHFQTIRSSVSYDKFAERYSQNIAAIYQKLAAEGIAPQGRPCAIIYGYDETSGNLEMAAAVGILSPLNVKDLSLVSFPIHNAAFIPYFGDSMNNETAHYAISNYISDRGYQSAFPAIEEYVTDPLKEKDPSKWQTNIYYYFADKK